MKERGKKYIREEVNVRKKVGIGGRDEGRK
jgi:hypothetical protein